MTANYSPRFNVAMVALLKTEGGFVNDPHDAGGATKYGISLRFLLAEGKVDLDHNGRADFDLDMDGDIDGQDIRLLSVDHAKALYYRCFWQTVQADQYPRPLGEALFDQAVNGGLVSARKLLQRAVNLCLMRQPVTGLLTVDGQIGPVTNQAVLKVLQYPAQGMPALMDAYREAAKERYRGIVARNPSQQRFLKGWLARADRLGREDI